MSKRKKKKPLPPRVKRMDRSARLQSAPSWLPTYPGKNIVAGYRKRFGVDWVCAFKELEMLGVKVDSGHKSRVLKSVEEDIATRRRKKIQRKEAPETYDPLIEQDDYFAYIAGYTPAGFAFGITWEEWARLEQAESLGLDQEPDRIVDDDDEEEDWEQLEQQDSVASRQEPDSTADDDSWDIPF